MEKYGLPLEGVTFPHPVIVIIDCHTGACGEGRCYEYILPAGTNIDEFAHDEAMENAQSFGSEGNYFCHSCCHESNDQSYCEDCETDMEWQENESIQGCVYKYQPGKSGIYVNGGDPIDTVIGWCIQEGAVTLDGNKIIVNKMLIDQLLYMPDPASILEFEKDLLRHQFDTLCEYVQYT